MAKTKILWTQESWNPVTGCTKLSKGCAKCYAFNMARRLQAMGQPKYSNGFAVTIHPECLTLPLEKRAPTVFFVNSMSDLFHADIPEDFIQQIFTVMNQASQHTFQVLTKRSARMLELSPRLNWTDNIFMGVTVEASDYYDRIEHLRQTPAKTKFLSLEPLLSALPGIPLTGMDWVIVAGESGPGARPMQADWVRDVRDECINLHIPFFFKQWGGQGAANKKRGRLLDGRLWNEKPAHMPELGHQAGEAR